MSDIITGLRQVIQDMVAPDLKTRTVKLDLLQKQIEIQHDATMKTIYAFRAEMRSEFAAPCANNQVESFRQMPVVSECVDGDGFADEVASSGREGWELLVAVLELVELVV